MKCPIPGDRGRLLSLIDAFPRRKLLVLGDLIADEFLYGQISRVSREAPVLILDYLDLVTLPGGAANAANNLLDLGCRVRVAGAVGADPPGASIVQAMVRKGADVDWICRPDGYSTPVKTRVLAGSHHSARQQIVRIDRSPLLNLASHKLWESPGKGIAGMDGVILSDYGYGAVSPALSNSLNREARRRSAPLVVDSRFRMKAFSGVTAITPNITELEESVGCRIGGDDTLLRRIGRRVMRNQRLGCLLVTQGRFGMTLFAPPREPCHIPIFGTDEVADVTGAGDTVIAVFTLALSCGGLPEEAAQLANYAGGIVVMKRGTATVSAQELYIAVQDKTLPGSLSWNHELPRSALRADSLPGAAVNHDYSSGKNEKSGSA